MKQKVRTVLIPELGLTLEPSFINEFEISTEFSRTLSHLVAQTGSRSIILKATSDGRLLVATAGGAFEVYDVENGTAANAFNAGNTYDKTDAFYVTDILIETNPGIISFRDVNGNYGVEKRVPVGFTSIDLVHYGMRIRNRTAGSNAVYEFTRSEEHTSELQSH